MKRKLGLVLLSILLLSSILAGCKSKEVYRVIKVNSFEGETSMNRAEEVVELFEGIQLVSNDKVTTGSDGLVGLQVDSDKNIVASSDTCFSIEAVGDETQGKVTIHLEYGTALIDIQNKLTDESEFEVVTPNATLSVRGTTFEVSYDSNTNETIVSVSDGIVEARTNIQFREIHAGETVVIQDVNIEGGSDIDNAEQSEEDGTENNGEEVVVHDSSADSIPHLETIHGVLTNQTDNSSITIKKLDGYDSDDNEARRYQYNDEYFIEYSYHEGNEASMLEEFNRFIEQEINANNAKCDSREMVNDEGDTIHYYQSHYAMTDTVWYNYCAFYKQIDENHFLVICISTIDDDMEGVWMVPEQFLDLTKDCYYVIE